jgi:transposase InsO family protein
LHPGRFNSKNEFFYYAVGLIYRRRADGKHQLLVPRTLVNEVIKQNHVPSYAAHPGVKRTYELIALSFLWPAMRRTTEEFISECDSCQRGKGDRELTAPLGSLGEPQTPFEMVSMEITGSYPATPRKNRYLLTFVDHFSKYAEVYTIQDQSAETCAKVFATQIVARHGSGYKLITDQGGSFMSTFYSETCRVLGVRSSGTPG